MLQGSYVALVTPFKNGSIDWTALERLICFHIENQTDGILLLGTTAETAALASDEKEALLRFAVQKINKQVPVMIGTGTNNLSQTISNSLKAKDLGADSLLIITPYYIKPTQKGLYEYYQAICEKVDLPIVIYNVPGRTGCNILPPTIVSLARDFAQIKGVKEASGSLVQATQIVRDAPQGFSLFSGEDALNMPLMAIGGKGCISVSANVIPRLMHQHIATCLAGDYAAAQAQHLHLAKINDLMFIETNPIPAKESLAMMGMIEAEFRLPICPLLEKNREVLAAGLKEYGLI